MRNGLSFGINSLKLELWCQGLSTKNDPPVGIIILGYSQIPNLLGGGRLTPDATNRCFISFIEISPANELRATTENPLKWVQNRSNPSN